jgi:hypothetical protein
MNKTKMVYLIKFNNLIKIIYNWNKNYRKKIIKYKNYYNNKKKLLMKLDC